MTGTEATLLLEAYAIGVVFCAYLGMAIANDWRGRIVWMTLAVLWPLALAAAALSHVFSRGRWRA